MRHGFLFPDVPQCRNPCHGFECCMKWPRRHHAPGLSRPPPARPARRGRTLEEKFGYLIPAYLDGHSNACEHFLRDQYQIHIQTHFFFILFFSVHTPVGILAVKGLLPIRGRSLARACSFARRSFAAPAHIAFFLQASRKTSFYSAAPVTARPPKNPPPKIRKEAEDQREETKTSDAPTIQTPPA